MNRWGVRLGAVMAIGLWTGCRSAELPRPAPPAPAPASASAPVSAPAPASAPVASAPVPASATAPASAPAPSGCVRGEPQPLLAAVAGKPTPVFVRTAALEARETYAAGDGPPVEIRHSGCAHFNLEFAFTLTAASDRDPGWQRAAELMERLPVVESMKPIVTGIAKLLRRQSGPLRPERLEISETEAVTVKVERRREEARLLVSYEFVL